MYPLKYPVFMLGPASSPAIYKFYLMLYFKQVLIFIVVRVF